MTGEKELGRQTAKGRVVLAEGGACAKALWKEGQSKHVRMRGGCFPRE